MESKLKARLEELEKTLDDFWNISPQTACFISMLIKATNAKNVLELGTSNGYSALWISDALRYTNGHLTTLEFWDKRQCLARQYAEECGLSEYITFKIGQAYDIIMNELQNETYDLVFIDANKREYIKFFEAVHPLLKKGGVILADNITSHPEKVQTFVDAISNHPEYQAQVLDLPDGLLMAYKL